MKSLSQSEAYTNLQKLLKHWSENEFKNFPDLKGVLQFGSTIKKPLKVETDLDLLLIFENLPTNRWDQFKHTQNLEKKINDDLSQLYGFNIQTSFILKKKVALDHLAPFYLDFPNYSKIWYDPENVLKKLLDDIQKWIEFYGSYRFEKGALWYWVYDSKNDPHVPVSFEFIKSQPIRS